MYTNEPKRICNHAPSCSIKFLVALFACYGASSARKSIHHLNFSLHFFCISKILSCKILCPKHILCCLLSQALAVFLHGSNLILRQIATFLSVQFHAFRSSANAASDVNEQQRCDFSRKPQLVSLRVQQGASYKAIITRVVTVSVA